MIFFFIPATSDYLPHRSRPPPPLAQLMSNNFPCASNGGGAKGADESSTRSSEPLNRAPETLKDLGAVKSWGGADRMKAACGLLEEARIGEPGQRPCQQQEF